MEVEEPAHSVPLPAIQVEEIAHVHRQKATKPKTTAPAEMQQGALIGAGLTLGITLASRIAVSVFRGVFRRKKQQLASSKAPVNSCASTPKSKTQGRDVEAKAFGSPTPIDPEYIAEQKRRTQESDIDLQPKVTLPPGQLKQQLQLLQEAQEENARLRAFMQEYMATSDKVKVLEQENADLKNVMTTLSTQLSEIKKNKSNISNGEELTVFKDAIKFSAMARSVCSDVDFGVKDNMSVDGSASVIDAGQRKRSGGLAQLFAWANTIRASDVAAAAPQSNGPSQLSSPRGNRVTSDSVSSDVVQLLNGFAGGLQF